MMRAPLLSLLCLIAAVAGGCSGIWDVSHDTPARETGWVIGQVYRLNRPVLARKNTPRTYRPYAYFPESDNLYSEEERQHPDRFGVPLANILPAGTLLRVKRIELADSFEMLPSVYPVAECLSGTWAGKDLNIGLLGVPDKLGEDKTRYFESLRRSKLVVLKRVNLVDLTPVP